MGRQTEEGDSPVGEMYKTSWYVSPSTPGHEESWWNQGGPPSKAKHLC